MSVLSRREMLALSAAAGTALAFNPFELLAQGKDYYWALRQGHVDGAAPLRELGIDDDTLAATDRFLAGEVPAPCRRLVSEARDGILRSARARAKDAQG